MSEPSFSLSEFMQWLEENNSSNIKIIKRSLCEGDKVNIRLSKDKLKQKIKEINDIFSKKEIEHISSLLIENGGIIKNISKSNAILRILGEESEDLCVILPKLFLRKFRKKS